MNAAKTHQMALHHASANASINMVRLLLDFGANIFAENANGQTALSLVDEDSELFSLLYDHRCKSCTSITSLIVNSYRICSLKCCKTCISISALPLISLFILCILLNLIVCYCICLFIPIFIILPHFLLVNNHWVNINLFQFIYLR